MLLHDENYRQLNIEDIKAALLNSKDTAAPTETELEQALGEHYQHAFNLESKHYELGAALSPAFDIFGIGRKILAAIKKFVCGFVGPGATREEIIDAVVKALASVIPSGIFDEKIVRWVVNFIVSKGIGAFCGV
ncbi:hypothetical protein [Mucilaginibacter psychrotolerans]|uniref:Uncharacterized protein n=1 Tax=Mucilaginibacter psychrotolerans TaxID=1524096 RepID=A0A4Y8S6B2_9SPHI|nr:hypothetical protein [Mucilaginibacter psychrotolerans]TFF33934.1 hypothetical protein E2R66_23945 [Mucilaginibacter psychrotolerans]